MLVFYCPILCFMIFFNIWSKISCMSKNDSSYGLIPSCEKNRSSENSSSNALAFRNNYIKTNYREKDNHNKMKRVLGLLQEKRITEGLTTAKKINCQRCNKNWEGINPIKKFLNALVLVHILIIVWPFDMYLKIRVMKPAWFFSFNYPFTTNVCTYRWNLLFSRKTLIKKWP